MTNTFIMAVIFAVGASISWGLNSLVLKMGAQDEGPLIALVIRAVFSLPILVILVLSLEDLTAVTVFISASNLVLLLLLVGSIIIGDGIFILSLRYYSVNLILPIAASYPLITTIILLITGEEIITPLILIGTTLVVIGIGIVTSNGKFTERFPLMALLYGLGTALGWGSSVYFAKLLLDQERATSLGLMVMRTLFIGLLALVLLSFTKSYAKFNSKPIPIKRRTIMIFGLSGILGWVLGATFLFVAIEQIGAAIPTPISATNPIIAVVIGYIAGIEGINIWQAMGILISTAGVILILL